MPRPYDFAVFATEVYEDPNDDSILPPGRVPPAWRIAFSSADVQIPSNSYYGKVYVEDSTRTYLISHKGTVPTNPSNLYADLELFLQQEPTVFQQFVFPFVNYVIANMSTIGYSLGGITGHSLGAAHAVLTANALGGNKPVTVFELPRPTTVSDLSYVQIYNSAPNLINTMTNPGTEVTRLYPPFSDITALASNVAPVPNTLIYATYTFQQHSMSKLLLQFDQSSGNPSIYSIENNWPISPITTQGIYSGQDHFSSYGQNTYYWNQAFSISWVLPEFARESTLFQNFVNIYRQYFSPPSVPPFGKTIVGDDSGNSFWGGTDYDDIYQGGAGNDEYILFGGDDRVIDTGGRNTYRFVSPVKGFKTISDSNPTAATITTMDGSSVAGTAYKVTSFGNALGDSDAPTVIASEAWQSSSLRSLQALTNAIQKYLTGSPRRVSDSPRDDSEVEQSSEGRATQSAPTTFVIPDSTTGRAFVAQYDSSGINYNVGDLVSEISSGNSLGLANFTWGDFGIGAQPPANFGPVGSASIGMVLGIPQAMIPLASSASINSSKIVLGYGNAGANGLYIVDTLNRATQISFPAGSSINAFNLASTKTSFAVPISAQSQYWGSALRIFDNSGSFMCDVNSKLFLIYPDSSPTGSGYIFASNDINTANPRISYIYLVSERCSYSANAIFTANIGPGQMPLTAHSNGNLYAVTFYSTQGGSITSDYINFYNIGFNFLSSFKMSTIGCDGNFLGLSSSMNEKGDVVTFHRSASTCAINFGDTINGYLSIYNVNGRQAEVLLFSGVYSNTSVAVPYLVYTTPQISFLDDGRFVLMWTKPDKIFSSITPVAEMYDTSLQLLQVLFSRPTFSVSSGYVMYGYRFTSSIVENGDIGNIVFTWFEQQGTGLKLMQGLVPFSISSTEVILGVSSSSSIDCTKSTATTCIAVAQEADGDVLVGNIGSSTTLVGYAIGAKTFKLKATVSAKHGHSEQTSSARDEDSSIVIASEAWQSRTINHGSPRRTIGTPRDDEEAGLPHLTRDDALASTSPTLQIWGVKIGDEIDISALPNWPSYNITNDPSGNYSLLQGPGGVTIPLLHYSSSAPFNLSMGPGGQVAPVPFFPPVAPPSGHSAAGLSGGAIAGAVIGTLAAIGLIAFGIYFLYNNFRGICIGSADDIDHSGFSIYSWGSKRGSLTKVPNIKHPTIENPTVINPIQELELGGLHHDGEETGAGAV